MKVLIVTAIYPTADNPAFGSYVRTQAESLKKAGVDIEMLILKDRHRKLIYPKAIFQLQRRLAGSSIDLVHAHYGLVGMVARTQWKVPVVITYHGSDLLGWINSRGERERLGTLIAGAGRLLARSVDAAIVQSDEMACKLKKSNVYVIPHEVDFKVFQPTERQQARTVLGLKPGKKYLLFAANPKVGVKRFPLAKAVADCVTAQDPSVELLVVSKETQQRLALYMSASDALIFPSYQEGSPNIVKQAMACNLPIVSSDVGDVRQLIGSTKDCYVCDSNVPEFTARIVEILAHRRRTDGRKHIACLESSAVAHRVIEVYQDVLRKCHLHAMAKRSPVADLLNLQPRLGNNEARQAVEGENES
ncbi:MAG TPA: glycosyltransferase [Candidatus Acidoferrum sp.]